MNIFKYNPNMFYGFIGHQNLGDEAIWEASKKLFNDANLIAYRKFRFSFFRSIIEFKKKQSIMLGGGTLIGADKKDGSNQFRDDFRVLSNKAKMKVVFGTGVGEFHGQAPDWLSSWKPLLNDCSYIGLRGPRSKSRFDKIGIDSEIIGDTACQWANVLTSSHTLKKKIGINIGATKGLITPKGFDVFVRFLIQLSSQGWQFTFFVINPNDLFITNKLMTDSKLSVDVHHVYEKTENYLSALDDVDYFIGTRLHAVILAMAKPKPSLMLGYADKAYDFMESVDMQSYCVDINRVELDELNNAFDNLTTKPLEKGINEAMLFYRDLQIKRSKEIIESMSIRN